MPKAPFSLPAAALAAAVAAADRPTSPDGRPPSGTPGPWGARSFFRAFHGPNKTEDFPAVRRGFPYQAGKELTNMQAEKERGAIIMEATFVFPIMLIVILLMLVLGNAYYQKCRIDAIIAKQTISGAAYCADPQLMGIEGGSIPNANNVTVYPYRAFSGSGATEMKRALGKVTERVNEQMDKLSTGLFLDMRPKDANIKIDYSNMVLTAAFSIEASYSIQLPVRMLFMEDWYVLKMNTRLEMPVGSATELIRNTDMAEDYMERYGVGEGYSKAKDKIIKAIQKVHDWLS